MRCRTAFCLRVICLIALLAASAPPLIYAAGTIVINEIMPAPASGNEWVELYNPGTTPIDISGWKIDDSIRVAVAQSNYNSYFNRDR